MGESPGLDIAAIDLSMLDGVVLAILALAIARGLLIGLIRESFSIAALGGACLAVRYAIDPAAASLVEFSEGEIGPGAAPWLAGAGIAIGTIVVVGTLGRWIKRGARAAGLGWADRLGGGALGLAEGALVAALLMVAAGWLIGPQHPAIADSRSAQAWGDVQALVRGYTGELPEVAAGPPGRP